MNTLKQKNFFLNYFVEVNRDDLFFITSSAFSTASSPIMLNKVGLLLPKDGLIFSSTVVIVVSVYQQNLTSPIEI